MWLDDGSVDLAILYRTNMFAEEWRTLTLSRHQPISSVRPAHPLTSRPTVRFSALHNLPLVHFCRPSSWRDHLEQISSERGVSLNFALELPHSLSLQTQIVSEGGGIYALLGPYAVANASKECRLKVVEVG